METKEKKRLETEVHRVKIKTTDDHIAEGSRRQSGGNDYIVVQDGANNNSNEGFREELSNSAEYLNTESFGPPTDLRSKYAANLYQ